MSSVTVSSAQRPFAQPEDLLSKKIADLSHRKNLQTKQSPTNPPPPTPTLPVVPNLGKNEYIEPKRRILSPHDHEIFLSSATHSLIVSFVFTLSDSVRNMTISDVEKSAAAENPTISTLLSILEYAEKLLQACPPLATESRFGNPAFRDYIDSVHGALVAWHEKLGITNPNAESEVATYLANSFGNATRIDYGSGHELNFILWLLCLRQLSIVTDDIFPALALIVFPRYLKLMRGIQSTYYLEPAGSHGVWGLDDYQFLPFLFGASQLMDHKHIRPKSIHNELVIEEASKDFLYLDQVQWVNASKTVQGLRWHSPMLDDISSAKSWAKVEAGMRKMFLAEVLGKLPVAQHFLFGSLLSAPEGMTDDAEEVLGDDDETGEFEVTIDGMKHIHNPNSWGDCCGIKVPSAIGARQEARKNGENGALRRVPFD